jgi:hypothetical protein
MAEGIDMVCVRRDIEDSESDSNVINMIDSLAGLEFGRSGVQLFLSCHPRRLPWDGGSNHQDILSKSQGILTRMGVLVWQHHELIELLSG